MALFPTTEEIENGDVCTPSMTATIMAHVPDGDVIVPDDDSEEMKTAPDGEVIVGGPMKYIESMMDKSVTLGDMMGFNHHSDFKNIQSGDINSLMNSFTAYTMTSDCFELTEMLSIFVSHHEVKLEDVRDLLDAKALAEMNNNPTP